jgi:hypothetical protein
VIGGKRRRRGALPRLRGRLGRGRGEGCPFAAWPRRRPCVVANTLRVERTKRLEGSRFVAWQLYGLVAGGSRERLELRQF